MYGFFQPSDLAPKTRSLPVLPQCGPCGLYKTCKSPKMPVDGKGRKGVLIVSEAPGEHEDAQGSPFVGKSGKLLEEVLDGIGVNVRRDCWLTNALICRPPDNEITNNKSVEYCRPNVFNAIKELKPHTIILMGGRAVESVINWIWKDTDTSITKWIGWQIPCQKLNAWVCPVWHPSYVLRSSDDRKIGPVPEMQFRQHMRAALKKTSKPFKKIPDYGSQITTHLDVNEASHVLDLILAEGKPVAFDFETDRLKPDHEDSRIVSCSVSNGNVTVAYPWHGKAVTKTIEVLKSDLPKVGWNMKFEDRWCRKVLGIKVKNWKIDGMLAAHALDNRHGTKSLKFQAFVRLGVGSYDDHVKPYLESDGSGNTPNRIREISLQKVLEYNAMDALLEWQLGAMFARDLGVEL